MSGYREGNEEVVENKKEQESGSVKVNKVSEMNETPEVGFLVLVYPGNRVEVATQLPGLKAGRIASLRDVRDICNAVSADIQTTMVAEAAASKVTTTLAEAAKNAQIAQMINKSGRGMAGLPRNLRQGK